MAEIATMLNLIVEVLNVKLLNWKILVTLIVVLPVFPVMKMVR
jgi:hypothetical protein